MNVPVSTAYPIGQRVEALEPRYTSVRSMWMRLDDADYQWLRHTAQDTFQFGEHWCPERDYFSDELDAVAILDGHIREEFQRTPQLTAVYAHGLGLLQRAQQHLLDRLIPR